MNGVELLCLGLLVVILCWCWFSNSKSRRENLYFQVIDDYGNHSSYQDPTLQELRLQILKREINNQGATVLMTPREMRLGSHPEDLDQTVEIHPTDIEDHGDYLVVKVVR